MNNKNFDSDARRASAEGKSSSWRRGASTDNRRHTDNRHDNRNNMNKGSKPTEWATAPYNFIPYDKKYISKAVTRNGKVYSGVIECKLETVTPLFIGDYRKKEDEDNQDPKLFFNVDGVPVIPASSLKGMIRNYIEIISCSFMSPVSNENIFYRDAFSDERYKNLFNKRIDGKLKYQGKAGFLLQDGSGYKIIPASFYPKSFKKEQPKFVPPARSPKEKKEFINKIQEDLYKQGYLYTGEFGNKIYYYEFTRNNEKSISVDKKVIEDFKAQLTKDHGKILWDKEKERLKKEGARVFYIQDENGKVSHIGLCKYFRICYKKNVSDLIGNYDEIDFAEGMFGSIRISPIKGRVQFSEARFSSYTDEKTSKYNLASPHASAYRHYLKQDKATSKITYNSQEAEIRGHKYYWHRDPEKDSDVIEKLTSTLKNIVESNSIATFRITVDRLCEEELGALFKVLTLDKDHALKLGAAKSYGLGSVKISIMDNGIKLQEVHDLYHSVSERLKNNTAIKTEISKEDINRYKSKFDSYIDGQKSSSYKETLTALDIMTNYKSRPSNSQTKYMPLVSTNNEMSFKNRANLKTVSQIRKKSVF